MHRALVLVIAACTTQHYVVDPHTDTGQRTIACMDECSPSVYEECMAKCRVDLRSECGELAAGQECRPTRQLHWLPRSALFAVLVVMAIGGAVSFVVAE